MKKWLMDTKLFWRLYFWWGIRQAHKRRIAREVEMAKAGREDWMMNFTGIVGLGGFVLLLIAIVFITVPEHNKELMIHTTGIVEGIVLSITGYYFGSIAKKRN